jgi:hypothetical protein
MKENVKCWCIIMKRDKMVSVSMSYWLLSLFLAEKKKPEKLQCMSTWVLLRSLRVLALTAHGSCAAGEAAGDLMSLQNPVVPLSPQGGFQYQG